MASEWSKVEREETLTHGQARRVLTMTLGRLLRSTRRAASVALVTGLGLGFDTWASQPERFAFIVLGMFLLEFLEPGRGGPKPRVPAWSVGAGPGGGVGRP